VICTALDGCAKLEQETDEDREAREAALRTLCKVVGQYSQAELRLAIRQHPDLPG
jgi:hypothetical protein